MEPLQINTIAEMVSTLDEINSTLDTGEEILENINT